MPKMPIKLLNLHILIKTNKMFDNQRRILCHERDFYNQRM